MMSHKNNVTTEIQEEKEATSIFPDWAISEKKEDGDYQQQQDLAKRIAEVKTRLNLPCAAVPSC